MKFNYIPGAFQSNTERNAFRERFAGGKNIFPEVLPKGWIRVSRQFAFFCGLAPKPEIGTEGEMVTIQRIKEDK